MRRVTELEALTAEARRRKTTYGRLVASTTAVEREDIVMRATRARRKAPVAVKRVTPPPPPPPTAVVEGSRAILGLRKQMGLSQAEFAKVAGVSQALVCRWERGKPPEEWRDLVARIERG